MVLGERIILIYIYKVNRNIIGNGVAFWRRQTLRRGTAILVFRRWLRSCVEKRKETSRVVVLCTLRAELHVLKQTDAEPVRSRSDELMRSSAGPPSALSLGGVDGAVQWKYCMVFYSTGQAGSCATCVVSSRCLTQYNLHKSKAEWRPAQLFYSGTSSIICNAPSLPTVIITSPSVFVENPASE